MAARVPTARAMQGIRLNLFILFWMVCGAAPPRTVLPSSVHRISDAISLTHVLIAIQDLRFGWGWHWGERGFWPALQSGQRLKSASIRG